MCKAHLDVQINAGLIARVDHADHHVEVLRSGSFQQAPHQFFRQATPAMGVFHDLTLLQIEGPPVPALPVADSDRVKEGQELAFMGFPIGGALGFSSVTHRAMVSSITQARLPSAQSGQLNERAIRGLREGNFLIFQLDATAYPGNSGGPLFDPASGEVVGVVNMVLLKGARESALSQPSGISYAIPARHVREMMARQRP